LKYFIKVYPRRQKARYLCTYAYASTQKLPPINHSNFSHLIPVLLIALLKIVELETILGIKKALSLKKIKEKY
jgi:hypothetical protein